MISFREAHDLVLLHAPGMEAEPCRLQDACGRVLRQEVLADRAFPPFDRVMMDGYAIRAIDMISSRKFSVSDIAPAGKSQVIMATAPGSCIEIMTGAPLPVGADCIVPVERTSRGDGNEIIVDPTFEAQTGMFIHRAASDAAEGEILLRSGILLGSREIGVAASCGAAILQVSKSPRITLIPTGDELVAVDATPAPHQIRQSNGHAIHAALQAAGYPALLKTPLTDDAGADDLRSALESSDWLILTGAVSKGARDFLPGLLDSLGCTKIFHGVAQRPGKPAGFWRGPQGQAIMALPGNPVSALTGLHAFVLPALSAGSSLPHPPPHLVVPAKSFTGISGMTHHLPVVISPDRRAEPAPTDNSGDFIGLLRSDGFVTLPPRGTLQAAYPFTPWR